MEKKQAEKVLELVKSFGELGKKQAVFEMAEESHNANRAFRLRSVLLDKIEALLLDESLEKVDRLETTKKDFKEETTKLEKAYNELLQTSL